MRYVIKRWIERGKQRNVEAVDERPWWDTHPVYLYRQLDSKYNLSERHRSSTTGHNIISRVVCSCSCVIWCENTKPCFLLPLCRAVVPPNHHLTLKHGRGRVKLVTFPRMRSWWWTWAYVGTVVCNIQGRGNRGCWGCCSTPSFFCGQL